ncbi:MAG: aminopeptidase [Deltaproteobacteria bacterium]|nr:aminopeptidase [Deltaproteobacteria bacterium]
MLSKTHLNRYADVLLWGLKTARTKKYQKGDIIMVRYDLAALRLAEILQAKIFDMGMNPILRMVPTPRMDRQFFEKADQAQLVFQVPGDKELFEKLNGNIFLHAPESITHLRHIEPKRIGMAAVARKSLRDILWKREEEGAFGWTLCLIPTPELAKQAGISLKQYANQVIKACYLNKKNPVEEWDIIYQKAISVKEWLNSLKVEYLNVLSDHIDLKVVPGKKRRWIGISGHNIPSFEIFLSPDYHGTEGIYYANQPSFHSGNYVKDVQIEFKNGMAVKISAKKGKDFLVKQLAMDNGAKRVGEFSLTDKRFSKINQFMANTLFDENFGGHYGNCHLALGSSYSDTYDGDPSKLTKEKKESLGFNDSALHWDLVNTEKKIVTAHLKSGEKKVIYANGMFAVGR